MAKSMADLSTYWPSVTPTHSAGRGGMRGALVQGLLYAFKPSRLHRSNYITMLMQILQSFKVLIATDSDAGQFKQLERRCNYFIPQIQ